MKLRDRFQGLALCSKTELTKCSSRISARAVRSRPLPHGLLCERVRHTSHQRPGVQRRHPRHWLRHVPPLTAALANAAHGRQ